MPSVSTLLLAAAAAASNAPNCWVSAGAQYRLPPQLLYAVAGVESSYNPSAVAHARNGTHSVGLMQINSSWFEKLSQHNISEADLFDPCTNIHVGAWILAQEVSRYGYTWLAIGSYYAGPYSERSRDTKLAYYREYSQKVLDRWRADLTGQLPKRQARTHSTPSAGAGARWIGDIASLPHETSQEQ